MGFLVQYIYSTCFILVRYPFIIWSKKPKTSINYNAENILKILGCGPTIHRGGIPENTIEGFRKSKANGASSVEVDLHFTKDGHPILLHDDTVDRTSNSTGRISTMTLKEVKKLDVGIKFGHNGVAVPTLDETLQAIKELDLFLFLEVKSSNKETIPTILKMFNTDNSLYDKVVIISFFPDVIYKISQQDPKIKCGYTTRGTMFSCLANGDPRFNSYWIRTIAELIETMLCWLITRFVVTLLEPSLLLPHKNDILQKRFDIEKYRKKGVVILTWTVNELNEQRHLSEVLGIHYMTDQTSTTHQ